jgi:hypothetical protein
VFPGESGEDNKGMKEWKKECKWRKAPETCMWNKDMTR